MSIRNLFSKAFSSAVSFAAIGAIALAGKSTEAVVADAGREAPVEAAIDLLVGSEELGYVQVGDKASDICEVYPSFPGCEVE